MPHEQMPDHRYELAICSTRALTVSRFGLFSSGDGHTPTHWSRLLQIDVRRGSDKQSTNLTIQKEIRRSSAIWSKLNRSDIDQSWFLSLLFHIKANTADSRTSARTKNFPLQHHLTHKNLPFYSSKLQNCVVTTKEYQVPWSLTKAEIAIFITFQWILPHNITNH